MNQDIRIWKEKEDMKISRSARDYLDDFNRMNAKEIRSFLLRVSPSSLRIVENLFNYRSTQQCPVENFQLKMGVLLFWISSSYALFEEEKVLGYFPHNDSNLVLSRFHKSRGSMEQFLLSSPKNICQRLKMGENEIYGIFNRSWQTRKAPPLYFPSQELTLLFLNTDLPNDMSFLLEHYQNGMDFFIYLPFLNHVRVPLDLSRGRYIIEDRTINSKRQPLAESMILYSRLWDGVLYVSVYGEITSDGSMIPVCHSFSIDLKNTSAYRNELITDYRIRGLDERIVKSLSRMCELTINLLLYGLTAPVFASIPPKSVNGKAKARHVGTRLLEPRYLTPSFISSSKPSSFSRPTNNISFSVSPHFRRGHWKRIAVGKGRCDRVVRWIRPTYVNAKPC